MGEVLATPADDIWLWTLSNVLVVCVPTALTTRMATMAINASTNPYSTKDWPRFAAFCNSAFIDSCLSVLVALSRRVLFLLQTDSLYLRLYVAEIYAMGREL